MLVAETDFAKKRLGYTLQYNVFVCVSMTSPCSLNRSATFL